MNRRIFLGSCAFGLSGLTKAAEPEIDRLIRQLGGEKYEEREKASNALKGIGVKALPALRKSAVAERDAEIRGRAARLVSQIEEPFYAELRCLKGHSGVVESVTFSPDGRFILSGSNDGTMRLWTVKDGAFIRRFTGHDYGVNGVAFSPDGRKAASASFDGTVRLSDVGTGRQLLAIVNAYWALRVCFSPDGKFLLCGDKTMARLWDIASGKEIRRFGGQTDFVRTVAFSPDGRLVAAAGFNDPHARFWDAETGKQLFKFARGAGFSCIGFSPDGRSALGGGPDRVVYLWDIKASKELHCFVGHTGRVFGVAFSRDGRRALSCSDDKTIRVWDVNGMELRCLEGHSAAVAWSPVESLAVSAGADHTVRIWRLPPWGRRLGKLGAVR